LIVEGFHLGTKIDGEVDGLPTAGADGDDAIGSDDDGVELISNGGVLQPFTNTVRVTVAGLGGILNGWIDFDGDGTFAGDPLEQIFTNVDLNPGTYELSFSAPDTIDAGMLGARFRWGEFGLGFSGPATIGEVEDYLWESTDIQPLVLEGDYNNDGVVNAIDYVVWRDNLGSSTPLPNDPIGGGGGGGPVNGSQYTQWAENFGSTTPGLGGGGAAGASSGESGDSGTDSDVPFAPTLAGSFASSSSTGGSTSVSRSASGGTASTGTSTSSRNAMLDLAMASLVNDDTDTNDDREMFQDQEEEYSELALAVALEEGSWWEN
jgi:hypothetical protein